MRVYGAEPALMPESRGQLAELYAAIRLPDAFFARISRDPGVVR